MPATVKTFPTPPDVANAFAQRLIELNVQAQQANATATVCLSGGSTPKLLFKTLAANHSDVDWSSIHFFWGDERCVPAESDESNFGEANRLFLSKANIPDENIHAVDGSIAPQLAASQYEAEIQQHLGGSAPSFDLMVLGMGDDGHTASIFPHEIDLLDSQKICEVATHPVSRQKRVTVTGRVIAAAEETYFLITGSNKADVLASIIQKSDDYLAFPTSRFSDSEQVTFWLDDAAAAKL
jgi:6-phosphogluconolactonase